MPEAGPSSQATATAVRIAVPAALGLACGALARHLPERLLDPVFELILPESLSCDRGGSVECFPELILTVLLSALLSFVVVLVVVGLVAIVGVTAITAGIVRLGRGAGSQRAAETSRASWAAMGLIFVGSALVVPPWWLVTSFVASI